MIAILLGTGFEDMEALVPYDMLKRGGVNVKTVSVTGDLSVVGGQGTQVVCDATLASLGRKGLEGVILPGGLRGVASLERSQRAMDLVAATYKAGGLVGAICAAPGILHGLSVLQGHHFTGYPSVVASLPMCQYHEDCHVVVDGNLVTAKAAGSAYTFGKVLLEKLTDQATAQGVMDGIYATTEEIFWNKEGSHVG